MESAETATPMSVLGANSVPIASLAMNAMMAINSFEINVVSYAFPLKLILFVNNVQTQTPALNVPQVTTLKMKTVNSAVLR